MRVCLFGLFAALGCAGGASGGAAPDLNGVWTVTMKYADGSCTEGAGGTQSAMWTVNQDAQGGYTVSVQGNDRLETLWGNASGSDVVLTGLADGYPAMSTQWKLSGSGASVKGRAFETRATKITRPASAAPKGGGGLFGRSDSGDSEKHTYCTIEWSVEATRQGA